MQANLREVREMAAWVDRYWANTERPNYEADVWIAHNRNKINLAMMRPGCSVCKGRRVLVIGARQWIEREFLEGLVDPKEIVKTDIVGEPAEGILEMDASRLQFEDGSFGVVIAREVIEHVADQPRVFEEIRRVLEPRGLFFISTPNGFSVPPDGKHHVMAYTPEGLLLTLEAHGFHIMDKRGNLPNLFSKTGPLGLSSSEKVLAEYKRLAEKFDEWRSSYYYGSQLFVLSQKGTR